MIAIDSSFCKNKLKAFHLLIGIVIFVLVGISVNLSAQQFAGGTGSAANPYLIANITHLQNMRFSSNSAHYKLINDIDATITATWNAGSGFVPLPWFGGNLDGDGFSISNFFINLPGNGQTALFSSTGNNAIIKNLNFINANITGGNNTALVAGASGGTIESIVATGTVSGLSNAGGLVGQGYSGASVSNVTFTGSVEGTGDNVGGIIGYNQNSLSNATFFGLVNGSSYVSGCAGKNEGTISNITVSADISASGNSVGGVAGWNNNGTIQGCSFSGSIAGSDRIGGLIGHNGYANSEITGCSVNAEVSGNQNVGGLIGYSQGGTIELSYSTGTVKGGASVGGLIGNAADDVKVSVCFSTSDVSPAGSSGNLNQFGGLIGNLSSGTVENCYSRGSVTGNNKVGGLIGEASKDATVRYSYSLSYVSGNAGQTGPLFGNVQNQTEVISCYWNDYFSGQPFSAKGTLITDTNALKTEITYQNWDFTSVWSIDPAFSINNGYPYLTALAGSFLLIWTGNIDTEWEKAGNWTQNRIPDISDNVIIPNDADNIAVLSSAAAVKSISIKPAGQLVIAHNGNLTVAETLSNSAGTEGLIIASNSSGTGSLIHNTNNVEASFQRYITGVPEAWHLLSSPMTNQPFSPEFTPVHPEDCYGDSTCYDLYHWHEPDTSWVYYNMPGLWATTHGSLSFIPGAGYLVAYLDTNPVKVFTGTLNNGTVTLPLTKSNNTSDEFGYILAGNPYPSSIDWKATSGWNRNSLEQESGGYSIYIWNDTAMNYGVYNSSLTSDEGSLGTGRYIAPTQGFFVKASQNGSITMNNDVRSHNGSGNWLRGSKGGTEQLALSVAADNGSGADQALVAFGHHTSEGNAPKKFSFISTAPALYLATNNKAPAAIRMLSSTEKHPYIPLCFKPGETGFFTFSAEFDKNYFQILIIDDLFTGLSHNLLANPGFTFLASTADPTERFAVRFREGNFANPHQSLPANIFTNNSVLYADLRLLDQNKQYKLRVYNLAGQMIFTQTMAGGSMNTFNLHNLQGIYIVRLTGIEGTLTNKLFW